MVCIFRMKWCELREYKRNEYVTIAGNRNLSNCERARKKRISGLQRDSNPLASALALQCSTSLSYEDPYTGGRPIYWVHQPVKGMKHRMKSCELREYKWNEYVTIAVNRNLKGNCHELTCAIVLTVSGAGRHYGFVGKWKLFASVCI